MGRSASCSLRLNKSSNNVPPDRLVRRSRNAARPLSLALFSPAECGGNYRLEYAALCPVWSNAHAMDTYLEIICSNSAHRGNTNNVRKAVQDDGRSCLAILLRHSSKRMRVSKRAAIVPCNIVSEAVLGKGQT